MTILLYLGALRHCFGDVFSRIVSARLGDNKGMGKYLPDAWLPAVSMRRCIVHWTAGAGFASSEDLEAYHLLIDRVGHPHLGDHSIADNLRTTDGDYAPHTRGFNAGSIGIALCGMAGANEKPFAPGKYPLTAAQWNSLIFACADLCRRYKLDPVEAELLMHCEVERVHGVRQFGKWDISIRTWDCPQRWRKMTPGEELRARVKILLAED
jgi:hypothetical protein